MLADLRLERQQHPTPETLELLEEYYEAAQVVQRDGPRQIADLLAHPASALWLARVRGGLAGCVLLKHADGRAVCKRLYVRPAFRGRGIARALMGAVESFARTRSIAWVYLDTDGETMQAAAALYRRLGYQACGRFNDNPQATLFFRKRL